MHHNTERVTTRRIYDGRDIRNAWGNKKIRINFGFEIQKKRRANVTCIRDLILFIFRELQTTFFLQLQENAFTTDRY